MPKAFAKTKKAKKRRVGDDLRGDESNSKHHKYCLRWAFEYTFPADQQYLPVCNGLPTCKSRALSRWVAVIKKDESNTADMEVCKHLCMTCQLNFVYGSDESKGRILAMMIDDLNGQNKKLPASVLNAGASNDDVCLQSCKSQERNNALVQSECDIREKTLEPVIETSPSTVTDEDLNATATKKCDETVRKLPQAQDKAQVAALGINVPGRNDVDQVEHSSSEKQLAIVHERNFNKMDIAYSSSHRSVQGGAVSETGQALPSAVSERQATVAINDESESIQKSTNTALSLTYGRTSSRPMDELSENDTGQILLSLSEKPVEGTSDANTACVGRTLSCKPYKQIVVTSEDSLKQNTISSEPPSRHDKQETSLSVNQLGTNDNSQISSRLTEKYDAATKLNHKEHLDGIRSEDSLKENIISSESPSRQDKQGTYLSGIQLGTNGNGEISSTLTEKYDAATTRTLLKHKEHTDDVDTDKRGGETEVMKEVEQDKQLDDCKSTKDNQGGSICVGADANGTTTNNEVVTENRVAGSSEATLNDEIKWTEKFEELNQYKSKHGNCNVPNRYPINQSLSDWVNEQRSNFLQFARGRSSSMSKERYGFLLKLGFSWSCSGSNEEEERMKKKSQSLAWREKFHELRKIKSASGHCFVSGDSPLSKWIDEQRQEYQKLSKGQPSLLSKEQYEALVEIGFVWTQAEEEDAIWMLRLEELKSYNRKFGNCNVPAIYAPNQKLSCWVASQREEYFLRQNNTSRASHLTKERIDALKRIGFQWTHDFNIKGS